MDENLLNTPNNNTQHYSCRLRLVDKTLGAQLNEPISHENKCVCNQVIDEGRKTSIVNKARPKLTFSGLI